MSFFAYMLRCIDGSLYTGCTSNLEKRLKEHNGSKKGAHYTKIRRPVVLVYSQQYATLSEARKREAEIKNLSKNDKENLVKYQ